MTKLIHPIIGVKEFEDTHAARILAKHPNGGWELFKEEKPEKSAKGGRKSNKRNTKESEE